MGKDAKIKFWKQLTPCQRLTRGVRGLAGLGPTNMSVPTRTGWRVATEGIRRQYHGQAAQRFAQSKTRDAG